MRTLRCIGLTSLVIFAAVVVVASAFGILLQLAPLFTGNAWGRDLGQWASAERPDTVPLQDWEHQLRVTEWYKTLMQPDYPSTSCCGEADAYWADSFKVGPDGQWVAIITDDRKNEGPRQYRPNIPVGTEIVVPNHKLKFDQGNPTGHGVIFIGSSGQVFCYVTPGGI